jgi:hypothetical protein
MQMQTLCLGSGGSLNGSVGYSQPCPPSSSSSSILLLDPLPGHHSTSAQDRSNFLLSSSFEQQGLVNDVVKPAAGSPHLSNNNNNNDPTGAAATASGPLSSLSNGKLNPSHQNSTALCVLIGDSTATQFPAMENNINNNNNDIINNNSYCWPINISTTSAIMGNNNSEDKTSSSILSIANNGTTTSSVAAGLEWPSHPSAIEFSTVDAAANTFAVLPHSKSVVGKEHVIPDANDLNNHCSAGGYNWIDFTGGYNQLYPPSSAAVQHLHLNLPIGSSDYLMGYQDVLNAGQQQPHLCLPTNAPPILSTISIQENQQQHLMQQNVCVLF